MVIVKQKDKITNKKNKLPNLETEDEKESSNDSIKNPNSKDQDTELSPKTLNNFLVSMRESIRQARVHIIHRHSRQIKQLSRNIGGTSREAGDDAELRPNALANKAANKKKATRLGQEIKAIKSLNDGDLAKLVLLETKTLSLACRDGSSGGRRAVCRVTEHGAVTTCKRNFNVTFKDTVTKLPFCIKVLGTKRRHKKLEKLDKKGKKDSFLTTENVCYQLLREIGGADFATAENLYNETKKKKKGAKCEGDEEVNDGETDNETDDEKESRVSQVLKNVSSNDSEDEEKEDNLQVHNKIYEELDAKYGKWEDGGSEDSDQDIEISSSFSGEKSEEVKNTNISVGNSEPKTKISHPMVKDSSPKKKKEENFTSQKITVKPNPTKTTDKVPTLPKVSGAEVMQLDLTKMASSNSTLQLGSQKRKRDIKLEDEMLCDLPKKLAYKRAKKLEEISETQKQSADFLFNAFDSESEEDEGKSTQKDANQSNWKSTQSKRGSDRGRSNRGRGEHGSRGDSYARGSDRHGGGSERGRGGSDRGRGRGVPSNKNNGEQFDTRHGDNTDSPAVSDPNLHPSWAAKMNQKSGMDGFKGKKITFD